MSELVFCQWSQTHPANAVFEGQEILPETMANSKNHAQKKPWWENIYSPVCYEKVAGWAEKVIWCFGCDLENPYTIQEVPLKSRVHSLK